MIHVKQVAFHGDFFFCGLHLHSYLQKTALALACTVYYSTTTCQRTDTWRVVSSRNRSRSGSVLFWIDDNGNKHKNNRLYFSIFFPMIHTSDLNAIGPIESSRHQRLKTAIGVTKGHGDIDTSSISDGFHVSVSLGSLKLLLGWLLFQD